MQHADHVHLLYKAVKQKGGKWADFGSGDGAFTLALRDLAGENVEIYSIDKDQTRLKTQNEHFSVMFPQTNIHFLNTDFTKALNLPLLVGIVMANSMHYVIDQVALLKKMKQYIQPQGQLIFVEYNTDIPNPWVPFPVSFKKFEELARSANLRRPTLLEKVPATWNDMYAATIAF